MAHARLGANRKSNYVQDDILPDLLTLLQQSGVRTIDDRNRHARHGFPVQLPLAGNQSITLDLGTPGVAGYFDPSQVGLAVIDGQGKVVRTWGLATRLSLFRASNSLLESPLGEMIENAFHGSHDTLYVDGLRVYCSSLEDPEDPGALLMITNAYEERAARRLALSSELHADTLRRLGKALTMNQQVNHITVSAAHEVASAAELAAVLIWTVDPSDFETLKLSASVGANRAGTNVLNRLSIDGGSSCVAELVATTRNPFFAPSVDEHMMTCDLEAKFCYLRPGGISVHPLVISDRLLGVMELIGRQEDSYFEDHLDLFQTVAEHFALALNAAIMFEEFEKLATHDALTGIANHRCLQEFLQQRVLEAARTGQELAVIMIDVDHFRSFNEEEGHDAGDEVLRRVADAMKGCVRPYDLAARYGGEEFTVVMPGSSMQTAFSVAERIRERVSSLDYRTRSGSTRQVTVSLGYAGYPHGGVDAPDLIKAADVALFEAKRSGRNRVVSFSGQSLVEQRHDDLDLPALLAWIPETLRRESEELYSRCLHDIVSLASQNHMTGTQTAILQALIRLTPVYLYAASNDREMLARMLAAEEFRLLNPSLGSFEDRFDEKGAAIPLLARSMAAILAIVEGQGKPFADDPGKFDPELIAMILERRRAA